MNAKRGSTVTTTAQRTVKVEIRSESPVLALILAVALIA